MAVEIKEHIPNVNGKPHTTLTDDEKFNHSFRVQRTGDGFVFYEVAVSKGSVPAQLLGRFSTMEHGVKKVRQYIEKATVSRSKARDKNTQIREARKASA